MTWLSVTAGRGPEECCIAVKHAMAAIEREAKQHDLECEVVEAVPAGNGFSSALLAVSGPDPGAFAQTWNGTIQWRCKSPVRPNHGRARWFIGVSVLDPLPDAHSSIRSDDLDYQTMKASGPGGQHVNKTESAVRLLHRPSGIVVSAQEERSQHRNKALALAKLVRLLADRHADAANDAQKTRWDTHNGLERGAAIRTFEGPQFKPKP